MQGPSKPVEPVRKLGLRQRPLCVRLRSLWSLCICQRSARERGGGYALGGGVLRSRCRCRRALRSLCIRQGSARERGGGSAPGGRRRKRVFITETGCARR
jgi:hypothetical protein